MTETKKYTFGLDKKMACTLSYAFGWISGLVFLLSEKQDKEIRFHAFQSIIFFGALNVLQIIFGRIPLVGWSIMPILGLVAFIGWLVLIIKTYQGEQYKLPFIGEIAQKQAGKS